MAMQLTIRYFASVREAIGRASEQVETRAVTAGELRNELIARGGGYAAGLARGKALRISLNQVMCDEATPLQDQGELAFFPPVTGG